MKLSPIWSQRLLRKGVFVEETYQLFRAWDLDQDVDRNLEAGLKGRFNSLSWQKEVSSTIGRRIKAGSPITALIVLAKAEITYLDWRDCWRLWIGATEEPFRSFAIDWLFKEHESGRYSLRSTDLKDFAERSWREHSPKRPLSAYGAIRMARDLVRTASSLGMLTGNGPIKTFATMAMADQVFLFYAHLIADFEGSTAKVVDSHLWRLACMTSADVHAALLRLHQFKHLDYQVAGSLVQLKLPARSARAYVEGLHA